MILIAYSGSEQTDWTLVSRKGVQIHRFRSQGYNPHYVSGPEIITDIARSLPKSLAPDTVRQIYFYGARLSRPHDGLMRQYLLDVFKKTDSIFIALDLLGAARALLGDKPGFAAILGTGTNTCIYDGGAGIFNIDSLGFLLGDEGSAAYLGKRLVSDFIRGELPLSVRKTVADAFGISRDELIDRLYTQPSPNRFCARYSRFIKYHLHSHPYFQNLVLDGFRAFFHNIVSRYPDYRKYTFNCVGPTGYDFRDQLTLVAAEYGMTVGTILPDPMDGLVRYHTQGRL
ncbi:MAG: N-acetylglucosamine kinase [Bacteroidales bacterium]|nr:N-acetylglucosamine kinase [Bacteroidales bacterium]